MCFPEIIGCEIIVKSPYESSREVSGILESTNLSRDKLGWEIGRTVTFPAEGTFLGPAASSQAGPAGTGPSSLITHNNSNNT